MSSAKVLLTSLFKSDYLAALILALSWQLLLTLVSRLIANDTAILDHTIRWDSGWYLTVIRDHYVTSAPSAVFYPLFPLLVSLVSTISFSLISLPLAGFLINTGSLFLAVIALVRLASYFNISSKFRLLPVAFLLAAPAAFFMHLFYTEALFLAISAWAYLFALQRKWWCMGLLLALLTAARLPSILFVALCGLEYLRAYSWHIKTAFTKRTILWFLLAPIGFISYGLYLHQVRGSFFAMFSAYRASSDWSYQVFDPNILLTLARAAYQPVRAVLGERAFDHDLLVNHIVPLFTILLLVSASIYALLKLRQQFIPLGIFGLLAIVMFSLNSNLVSVHRYILPCLVVYIIGAYLYTHRPRLRPILIATSTLTVILQAVLYLSVLRGGFVG